MLKSILEVATTPIIPIVNLNTITTLSLGSIVIGLIRDVATPIITMGLAIATIATMDLDIGDAITDVMVEEDIIEADLAVASIEDAHRDLTRIRVHNAICLIIKNLLLSR